MGLALEPYPGSNLVWTPLGWGWGLFDPSLKPLAFVPLVGLACPGKWLTLPSFLPGLVGGIWLLCAVQVGCGWWSFIPNCPVTSTPFLGSKGRLKQVSASLSFSFRIPQWGC